jgi:hypothetical protein
MHLPQPWHKLFFVIWQISWINYTLYINRCSIFPLHHSDSNSHIVMISYYCAAHAVFGLVISTKMGSWPTAIPGCQSNSILACSACLLSWELFSIKSQRNKGDHQAFVSFSSRTMVDHLLFTLPLDFHQLVAWTLTEVWHAHDVNKAMSAATVSIVTLDILATLWSPEDHAGKLVSGNWLTWWAYAITWHLLSSIIVVHFQGMFCNCWSYWPETLYMCTTIGKSNTHTKFRSCLILGLAIRGPKPKTQKVLLTHELMAGSSLS